MKVVKTNNPKVIKTAVNVLKKNGLVIYPTETCYGAGVSAINQKAVNKLLTYKTFRSGKPISIAVSNQVMAEKYVKLNDTAKNLYQKFLPGPLTVISKGEKGRVAPCIQSSTQTIGIRIPDYPLIIKIINRLGSPITATSANVSYKKQPYSVKDILNNTSQKQQNLIDLIIDAGTLPKRPSSTVVDTTLDDPLILRQGKILYKGYEPLYTTKSPQETINLAKTLLQKHLNDLPTSPLLFLLIGDLGVGKTQFTKGLGQFLNIKTPITSPTYTILKEYNYDYHQFKGQLIHLDTWRMQDFEELKSLKLQNYLKPQNIISIEWADRALTPILKLAKQTNAKLIQLKISFGSSPNLRLTTFSQTITLPDKLKIKLKKQPHKGAHILHQ